MPPTYVNVAELIPRPPSRDLDMSNLFPDPHGVWKQQQQRQRQQHRSRDHWQDGDRTTTGEATTHKPNSRRRPNSREDCLANGCRDGGGQCNGVLPRVKSLESVCKAAADETPVDGRQRVQRVRRRRRPAAVRRSASTSRCLVNQLSAPANG